MTTRFVVGNTIRMTGHLSQQNKKQKCHSKLLQGHFRVYYVSLVFPILYALISAIKLCDPRGGQGVVLISHHLFYCLSKLLWGLRNKCFYVLNNYQSLTHSHAQNHRIDVNRKKYKWWLTMTEKMKPFYLQLITITLCVSIQFAV